MTLVYSTAIGRIKAELPAIERPQTDGIIRIQRQVSGRKGKGVSVITGFNLDARDLMALASELKRRSGCGGSVKNGTIEIQGDNREQLKQILEQKGFKVRLSGG